MGHALEEEILIERIRELSPEKAAEVVDFVDFLWQRDTDRRLVQAAARLSEASLRKVWDNEEDAVYDEL